MIKRALNGRLVWYKTNPDERFWFEYWRTRVTPREYEIAKGWMTSDEAGAILLNAMPRQGLYLEAGCGAGFWVQALLSKGFKVEGIENSIPLISLVQQVTPDLPIRIGDALAIDRDNGHYDGYLSFGVVEHREDGPGAFLDEAFRVLKPGGCLLLSVPFFGPLRKTKALLGLYNKRNAHLPFYQYGFSAEDLTDLIRQHGFVPKQTHALYLDRMLTEELPFYRGKARRPFKALFSKLLPRDGHMLLIVANKKQ